MRVWWPAGSGINANVQTAPGSQTAAVRSERQWTASSSAADQGPRMDSHARSIPPPSPERPQRPRASALEKRPRPCRVRRGGGPTDCAEHHIQTDRTKRARGPTYLIYARSPRWRSIHRPPYRIGRAAPVLGVHRPGQGARKNAGRHIDEEAPFMMRGTEPGCRRRAPLRVGGSPPA